MEEYAKEQLWELYEQLPEDLQKAVFSEEIGAKVRSFCYDNDIKDKEIHTAILKNICYLFLGLTPPEEFHDFLKKELKIKNDEADNIFARINNEILINLKESLESLYGIKLKFKKTKSAPVKPAEKPQIEKPDKYRELID